MKKLLTILILFLAISLFAAMKCSQCSKKIKHNYLTSEGNIFCSEECFHATLPTCSYCKQPCVNGYMFLGDQKFCSDKCMAKVYYCSICRKGSKHFMFMNYFDGKEWKFCAECNKLPKCYFCSFPTKVKNVNSGKYPVCQLCEKNSVDLPERIKIFRKIRADLARLYRFNAQHGIEVIGVSIEKMAAMPKPDYFDNDNHAFGLMSASYWQSNSNPKKLTIKDCKIYYIESLPKPILIETLAHELTHDFLRHKVGIIDDPVDEEGFCELIAALYNEYIGQTYLNTRKENNPNSVYGDGYRKIHAIYEQNNKDINAVLRYLKK